MLPASTGIWSAKWYGDFKKEGTSLAPLAWQSVVLGPKYDFVIGMGKGNNAKFRKISEHAMAAMLEQQMQRLEKMLPARRKAP